MVPIDEPFSQFLNSLLMNKYCILLRALSLKYPQFFSSAEIERYTFMLLLYVIESRAFNKVLTNFASYKITIITLARDRFPVHTR